MSIHIDPDSDMAALREEQVAKLGGAEFGTYEYASLAGGWPPSDHAIMAPLELAEQVAAGAYDGETPLEMSRGALESMGFETGTPSLTAQFTNTMPAVETSSMDHDNLASILTMDIPGA